MIRWGAAILLLFLWGIPSSLAQSIGAPILIGQQTSAIGMTTCQITTTIASPIASRIVIAVQINANAAAVTATDSQGDIYTIIPSSISEGSAFLATGLLANVLPVGSTITITTPLSNTDLCAAAYITGLTAINDAANQNTGASPSLTVATGALSYSYDIVLGSSQFWNNGTNPGTPTEQSGFTSLVHPAPFGHANFSADFGYQIVSSPTSVSYTTSVNNAVYSSGAVASFVGASAPPPPPPSPAPPMPITGSPVLPPGGRLVAMANSCAGAPPIQFANVPVATVLCYVPKESAYVSIAGSNYGFATQTLSLTGTVAGNIYDVFELPDPISGLPVPCFNANPWPNSTTRADQVAQGSYASWVNTGVLASCVNGALLYSNVAAGVTYLGSFKATANGTTQWEPQPPSTIGGAAPCLCVYNAPSGQELVFASDGDASTSIYITDPASSWINFLSSTNNRISYLDGLGFSLAEVTFNVSFTGETAGISGGGVGTCVDSSTGCDANSGAGINNTQIGMTGAGTTTMGAYHHRFFVGIGFHYFQEVVTLQSGQTLLVTGSTPFDSMNVKIKM